MSAPDFAFGLEERHDDDVAGEKPAIDAIRLIKGAAAVGALAFALFSFLPSIDLAAARLFYNGNGQFAGNQLSFFPVLRFLFNAAFYATCAVTVGGLLMTARTPGGWLGERARTWVFLAVCLLMGPLAVANMGFKDNWGRARPRDVVEFAGNKVFTPPLWPSGQCARNCSFVSGEASSIFMVLFALALLFRSLSRNLMVLAVLLGGLAGLTRMAQGGHFLSDVIFAGVFMAMTAACLQLLFDKLERGRAEMIEPGLA